MSQMSVVRMSSWNIASCSNDHHVTKGSKKRRGTQVGNYGQRRKWCGRRCSIRFSPCFFAGKPPKKTENSNLHGFELHRPPRNGTKLLLQALKAIINHKKESYI